MAILKIARMGHPVLARPAAPVEDPTAPAIRQLVQDMIETMEDAPGTGLAAPQVHVPLRLVIFKVEGARARREDGPEPEAAGDGAVPLTVLINPEIEPLSEDKALGWEACLSVPELAGEVPRYTAIRYRAWTRTARPSSARPGASTPALFSTNATTWTASSTRSACST